MAAVLNQTGAPKSPLAVPLKSGGSYPPLFIVHGVGGNVMELIPLGKAIRSHNPVYAIQAKGLDALETPNACVEDMAECYLPAIREIQPQGPYLLAGYSFGGLVALEIGRRLLEQGEKIGFLAF